MDDCVGRSASVFVTVHVFNRQQEFIILVYANGFEKNLIVLGCELVWADWKRRIKKVAILSLKQLDLIEKVF